MPAASLPRGWETRPPSPLRATSWENEAWGGGGERAEFGDVCGETGTRELGVGRKKDCSPIGDRWFGGAASESYNILRSNCTGLPPRSPLSPNLAQPAVPSAWPAWVVLMLSAAESPAILASIAQPALYMISHGLCFVVHAQGPSLSACVPQMFVSERASQKSEVHGPPQGFTSVALHKRWEGQRESAQGSRLGHALPPSGPCVCARAVCLGPRGGVSRTAGADVRSRGSARHPSPPVAAGGSDVARYLTLPRDPLQTRLSPPLPHSREW